MNVQDILKKHEQYIFPSVITYYEELLPFKRGEGQCLYGVDSKRQRHPHRSAAQHRQGRCG
jgi:hypothetical protein